MTKRETLKGYKVYNNKFLRLTEIIEYKLKKKGLNHNWLIKQMNITKSEFYKMLHESRFTEEQREKLEQLNILKNKCYYF